MEFREELAKALRNKHTSNYSLGVKPWDQVLDVFKRQWLEIADLAIELVEKHNGRT